MLNLYFNYMDQGVYFPNNYWEKRSIDSLMRPSPYDKLSSGKW